MRIVLETCRIGANSSGTGCAVQNFFLIMKRLFYVQLKLHNWQLDNFCDDIGVKSEGVILNSVVMFILVKNYTTRIEFLLQALKF